MLAFTLGASLLCCVLCGLVPAFQISRPNLGDSLKDTNKVSTGTRGSGRALGLLVVADVALALVLLIGAGLMIRSLSRIEHFDPGFKPRNVLALSFEPPVGASEAERLRVKREILAQVSATPDVQSAALTSHVLFGPGTTSRCATKSKSIWNVRSPCGIGEVVRPRGVTYSVTCQAWLIHELCARRTFPTIWSTGGASRTSRPSPRGAGLARVPEQGRGHGVSPEVRSQEIIAPCHPFLVRPPGRLLKNSWMTAPFVMQTLRNLEGHQAEPEVSKDLTYS